ncbi:hypothetical protein GG344DRAFT_72892 [Lentinula edodes]|nr:hypothetical protein GG344DRAFT_72892 [Lentinula edodes]
MSTKATTKHYIQLLMCNFLGTLFILLSLDLNVTTAIHSQLLVTLPFFLFPPTSVAIAVMLLRSWAYSNPERSTPLPQYNPEAMNHEDVFANKMVLVGFFHVLMVLSRVLALASGSCIVFFIGANDTPNAPLNQSCWASFGLCWFWLSIITFGHCLLCYDKLIRGDQRIVETLSSTLGWPEDGMNVRKILHSWGAFHIAGCDLIIGHHRLDSLIAKQLYSALVDCNLINGCEIAIDTDNHLLSMLEQVQPLLNVWALSSLYGRSSLHRDWPHAHPHSSSHSRSPISHLSTQTPARPLCLSRTAGEQRWLLDLDWAISHLPSSTLCFTPLPLLSEQSVVKLIKSNSHESNTHLQSEVDNSHRLVLFVHSRREPQKEGPAKYVV